MTLETKQLDGLVGIYTALNPPSPPISYEVSRERGRLFAEMKGFSPKSEIYATSADSFFTTNGLAIDFTRDSSGQAVKVKLGGRTEATRKQ